MLEELERQAVLVYTPSRKVSGKRVVCYDDYIAGGLTSWTALSSPTTTTVTCRVRTLSGSGSLSRGCSCSPSSMIGKRAHGVPGCVGRGW